LLLAQEINKWEGIKTPKKRRDNRSKRSKRMLKKYKRTRIQMTMKEMMNKASLMMKILTKKTRWMVMKSFSRKSRTRLQTHNKHKNFPGPPSIRSRNNKQNSTNNYKRKLASLIRSLKCRESLYLPKLQRQ